MTPFVPGTFEEVAAFGVTVAACPVALDADAGVVASTRHCEHEGGPQNEHIPGAGRAVMRVIPCSAFELSTA